MVASFDKAWKILLQKTNFETCTNEPNLCLGFVKEFIVLIDKIEVKSNEKVKYINSETKNVNL